MDGHWASLSVPSVANPLNWTGQIYFLLIILVLLLWLLIPQPTHWHGRLFREFLLVAPAALLYFAVRGLMDARETVAIENANQIIDLERGMNIFWEPVLQRWIIGSDPLVSVVNWIYIWAHWPILIATLLWLVIAHHDRYPVYRNAVLISGAIGITIFAMYPVAPPRLMPELGVIDTVTLRSTSYRVLQPPALTNVYAAMPSLHFGWNLLMGIAIVRESRTVAGRLTGYVLPIAMLCGVVLTANHYILDAVAGGVLVLGSMYIVRNVRLFADGLVRQVNRFAAAYQRVGFMPRLIGQMGIEPASDPVQYDGRRGAMVHHRSRPITVAHRAGNSVPLARRAEGAGIDLIEADVWLHRGRLELRHSKTLGPVPVRWDRWSLERTSTPSLELPALLEGLDSRTQVLYDIKGRNPDLPDRLVEAVNQYRPGAPILVCSQNWDLLERFRNFPEVTLVHSIGNRRQLRAAWARLEREDHDAVSIHARLLDTETVHKLKERVSFVITWPINSDRILRQVLSCGVDGVISDNHELLARVVAGRGRAEGGIELASTPGRNELANP